MCCSFKCFFIVTVLIAVIIPNLVFYYGKDSKRAAGSIPFITPKETWGFTFEEMPDQTGRIIIITGANVGLGLSSAKLLAMKNAKVIMACRSAERCDEAAKKVKEVAGPASEIDTMLLDLASLHSVKKFADSFLNKYNYLNALMLNAGIMHTKYGLSKDGIEQQFAVNHVGHQFLTMLLLPLLEETSAKVPTFIASVSSSASHRTYPEGIRLTKEEINNESTYSPFNAYGQTKLSNVLMAQELTRQLTERGKTNVFVNSVHPGLVNTELIRQYPEFMQKYIAKPIIGNNLAWDPDEAALSQVYLCTDNKEGTLVKTNVKGTYFVPLARVAPGNPKHSDNLELQKKLWVFTQKLIEEVMA